MIDKYPPIIDFHSHILPGLDDGSDSLETSVKMLELSRSQGVDVMLATSHYYDFSETVPSFLERREEAVYRLCTFITEHDLDVPELVIGAEVRLYPNMHRDENLDKLCIEGTRNILVEMPYGKWSSWMLNEVYALISKGYRPIMAHVERYLGNVREKEILNGLLSLDVLVQCNADSFRERRARKFVKKLIKLNKLTVIGSDSHNMSGRISHFDDACNYIRKKFGPEYLDVLMENAAYLIK